MFSYYRDLETSKESEVSDARGKMQAVKTEYETRFTKEREEAKSKFEEMKNKYTPRMCSLAIECVL